VPDGAVKCPPNDEAKQMVAKLPKQGNSETAEMD